MTSRLPKKYIDSIEGLTGLRKTLERAMTALRPPPDLSVAEWADKYRYLSSEASEEYGKWHNERTPYLVAPMEHLSPQHETETLILQPTLRPMAEDFSRERIAPMIRDTPALTGRISDSKARTSGNTILHKRFPGGFWAITGSNSPAGLASRPIRFLLSVWFTLPSVHERRYTRNCDRIRCRRSTPIAYLGAIRATCR